jgi:hypothetical protein
MAKKSENYLVISDLQIPFEAKGALRFCIDLKKEFNIPDENCLCVGDEVDQYFGSLYLHDPDATLSPASEVNQSIKRLKEWYAAFPKMLLAESNHGQRWAKKAAFAGIPSVMMRKYQEVLEAPASWHWAHKWLVKASRQHFLMMHGMGYSGMYAYRQMAMNNGISTVHGHLHSGAGIAHIRTEGQSLWGANAGCLIDVQSYAFHYNKDNKFKPDLGCIVVLNGGTTPIWVPFHG